MIRMCIKFEKYEVAFNYLKICENIYKEFDDDLIKAQIYYSYGLLFMKKYEFKNAVNKLNQAGKIYGEINENN